ncbi:metal-sulfur cluster biosynthetic enzyme [Labedaea rhizosphaerae]|uniref:Metal-sulfur cluster biosynthetic enzyme n=1 Tax=Labedaea rhizosphaerae TaxID=598644 RepID=A0A4R6S6J5_LABRH|nr:iron-sulfur cluster assembly protein [Labedaea rhizosphaerae]TDP94817.1 metal-sulfur cluster biosynthetic enzyme [Labedaea rhizosphaerae]
MTTVAARTVSEAVWAALGTVRDPELDEPLTDLGFVARCAVTGGDAGATDATDAAGAEVAVQLRLPTYFCAPNFAFLMVADAHDAVSAVPGVGRVVIELIDHFAADSINQGVAARAGFVGTFGDEAADELDDLRADFLRKAVLAGTDRVCRAVLAAGADPATLGRLTLGDAPASADRERLRDRRRELGLPSTDDAPLVLDPATGNGVEDPAVRRHLGLARLTRVSQEANSGVCRGMLLARYPGTQAIGQVGHTGESGEEQRP